jgi:hypothetical protein
MAYSGTVMLCTQNETSISSTTHTSGITIGLTSFLCAVTLLSIFLNYRDQRSKYALSLAFTGSVLSVISTAYTGGIFLYYTGVVLIFFGIWLNGSLFFFINKIKTIYHKWDTRPTVSITENPH